MKKQEKGNQQAGILRRAFLVSEGLFSGMYASYSRLLGLSLNHKRIVIGGAVVLLAVSAGLVPLIGTEVIPEQDQG